WSYADFFGKTSFQWDIAPLPRGPVRNSTIYVGGQWSISSQTHYPEQAWRLVKFLVSDKSSEMSMRCGRAMAANRAVTERLLKHPGIPPENDYMWLEIMADARHKDFEFSEMGVYLRKARGEIGYLAQGRRTPEQACRNFTRIYNEGLDILWEEEGGP
ncbi:MAG: extracellular solute-binding protein, partial [Phycisphaerae bacterium]|nr:extracellular solute-binding protein [Phycisphaerae bacterium]